LTVNSHRDAGSRPASLWGPAGRIAAWAARHPAVSVPAAAALGAAILTALSPTRPSGVLLAAAGAALAALAAMGRLSRPPQVKDVQSALRVVEAILDVLQPGPEHVTAVDPALARVEWDLADGDTGLAGERADKMLIVACAVRGRAARAGMLHRLPQLLLVATDGATAELLGRHGTGRTGILISLVGPDGAPACPPAEESAGPG
jgi:hypothetical protein